MLGGNEIEAGYQPSLVQGKAHKFVVLSGYAGAGKSSLLTELGRRGFPIYEEPGRQAVKEQLYIGSDALPWGKLEPIRRADDLAIHSSLSDRRPPRPIIVFRPRDHRSGQRSGAPGFANPATP